jgi:enoyl-CoA hydratase
MIGSAQLVQAQLHVPQPMIAAINGDALGLGATLGLFCDMVFLADDARIGDPHVKAGIVAGDGGAILWPLLLGLHRGKEYLLTGDMMTAAEAYEFGLVNHVVPRAEVLTQATALATRLARGARVPIEFNKRLANASLIDRVNRVLDASLAMEAITFETADHREAVRAFMEKREPVFGEHNRTAE